MKTILCVPGDSLRKVEMCRTYGADRILFDLEDSVPQDRKEYAAAVVREHVRPGDAIRVASLQSKHLRILEQFPPALLVWLPKIRTWSEIPLLGRPLVVLVETPQAVLRLPSLPDNQCVRGLAVGIGDLSYLTTSPLYGKQTENARVQVALTGRASSLITYDSPPFYLDRERTQQHVRFSIDCGYDYVGVLHPKQIPWVREEAAKDRVVAERILAEYDGSTAVTVTASSEFLGPPIVAELQRLIAQQ